MQKMKLTTGLIWFGILIDYILGFFYLLYFTAVTPHKGWSGYPFARRNVFYGRYGNTKRSDRLSKSKEKENAEWTKLTVLSQNAIKGMQAYFPEDDD